MSPVLIHVSTLLYAVAYNGFETLSRELDLTTQRTICRQLASAIMKNRNPKNLELLMVQMACPVESWV
jgi:hypothetical protein